jgi:hypothetical protein
VAKSNSPARGRAIATALCHSWAVATAERFCYYADGTAKRCCWAVVRAVRHSYTLAASASASTATITVTTAAALTTAGTAAAAATTTVTAAGTAAATTTAGTAAAATATTVTAAVTTAGTAAAAATCAAAAASMGPDWIRQDYRHRERQQEDKAGFHSILGGIKLPKYQLSAW